ncbi:MAG: MFS transporter [Candidatus Lokiarchaeota archaeon]|nr:MFS transporter [Candidatus Lokiarchaeota archaeon]
MEKSAVELKKTYIGIFSLNYFTQGITQSFFTTIIPIYLLQLMSGLHAGEVSSVMSMVLLPFGVKFIYGILSDKYGLKKWGRRKPWIIFPSIISGLIWILVPFLLTPDNAMLMITLLGILIVIGVAMGDTAIDGLILDLCPKERLGRVQGICWGFRSVGIIAGGPLIVMLFLGFRGVVEFSFIVLGIAMIIFPFLVLIVKEVEKPLEINALENLKIIFGKLKNWKVFVFSLFNAVCDGVIFVILPLFVLIQWGLVGATGSEIDLIGNADLYAPNALVAFVVGLGVIAGALIGGRIADLQSRKRSVYFSLFITTGSFLLFVIPVPWYILMIFAFFIGGSAGWRNSAFSAVIGQESQQYPEMDSTYYATCNSFVNLGGTIGLQLTSILFICFAGLPVFGIYALIFLIMAILINLDFLPFFTLDPKEYEINREINE